MLYGIGLSLIFPRRPNTLLGAETVVLASGIKRISSQLKEPPDIVAQFAGANLGIACKKLYSENNVEKVLSNGVAQIEEEYEYGVVAVNLDDLLPPEKILVQDDHEGVARALNQFNLDFMNRHERHLRKYLGTGRILSTFVSTGVLTDIRGGNTRLHNARQSTGWMIPGLPEDKQRVFRSFCDALMQ